MSIKSKLLFSVKKIQCNLAFGFHHTMAVSCFRGCLAASYKGHSFEGRRGLYTGLALVTSGVPALYALDFKILSTTKVTQVVL